MMLILLLVLLLSLVGYAGYQLGCQISQHRLTKYGDKKISSRYFEGLNFLLNEQPDKAVDVFIQMIEVDTDTVETHLALGSLFRRRGEVDRAIRIHQNLIARPSLSRPQRVHALYELGQDYMRAGVLDRAETLFLELVNMGEMKAESLEQLIDIYQQQREWYNAIAMAQKLEALHTRNMSPVIAHYFCELAEENREEGSLDKMMRLVRRALFVHNRSIRAQMLQAEMAMQSGKFRHALHLYHAIAESYPAYVSEILAPLAECYDCLEAPDGLVKFLQKHLSYQAEYSVVKAVLEKHRLSAKDARLQQIIIDQLEKKPSLDGVKAFIDLQCNTEKGVMQESWRKLQGFVTDILAQKPSYQCDHCGLTSKTLYWFCPSCKHWDTVKPITALSAVN